MSVYSFGPFRLNVSKRLLEKDGAPIVIGGRKLDLLIALIDRTGAVVGVRELMALIWPDVTVEEANLRVSVFALRKALQDGKDGARYILNVPGRGYTFVAPLRNERAEGPAGDNNTARSALRSGPLPEVPQLLVGRHDTVKNLAQLVLSQRFVSVVGPGGIGKTTVALAVAHSLRYKFDDDCVCFVDGGAISDPDDLPCAVASAFGCPVADSDPLPGIFTFLTDRRTLLILDSCEHIIEAAASLSEVLFQAAETVHLLITSREALRLDGETVHQLQRLHDPLDKTPTALQAMATPAVQFMDKATASGHLETLSDREAPIVANICSQLNRIALAIEMVASRVGIYGILGTVDLIDNGAELVLQGRGDGLPRHQTLQALHDWSYRRLSAYEQAVLARLSVFVGELTLAAAHAVGDAEDDREGLTQAIADLGDKSLIQVSSVQGSAENRLLDTTRAYASYKLAERGEKDEIARGHALYFSSVLEQTRDRYPFTTASSSLSGQSLSTIGILRW